MQVIVPAAGLSSRFPGTKPKYLLYSYNHQMMLKNAVRPFIGKYPITVGILRQHNELYNAEVFIKNEIPGVNVVVLDNLTQGPADTVHQVIRKSVLNYTDSLLIKDCDSFFEYDEVKNDVDNFICTSRIQDHPVLRNLNNKSFIRLNDQGIVLDIAEKSIVSDTFCVGGYKFNSIKSFCSAFYNLMNNSKDQKRELYVSDVIQYLLSSGEIFTNVPVYSYWDVGTLEDWQEYNNVPVIFCDIDGTIIEAQGRYGPNNYYDMPKPLKENIHRIQQLESEGAMIVFTTAREKKYDEVTRKMLEILGFSNFKLISGLYTSKRILINDYNEANPFPRAEAVNIRRNSDNLKDVL